MTTTKGYYRYPTIHKNKVVFVCEDDLWEVKAGGGGARRLTANLSWVSHPRFSPDGEWLAFIGHEEGEQEVYMMPAGGGPATRLTYLGSETTVLNWTPDGQRVVFASNAGQPFSRLTPVYAVDLDGGEPELLPCGPAQAISFGSDKRMVIGRWAAELAYWKRYRGGRTGDIWIDRKGKGKFKKLLKNLESNMVKPIWLKDRIYFLSDHEGIGNIYSCTPKGEDIQRHTHHKDYYVRNPASDGQRIVYHAGADLYILDPFKKKGRKQYRRINIKFRTPQVQRNRKFIRAASYLEHYDLHPKGHSLTLTTRGKFFAMPNWSGASLQYGEKHGVRYRLSTWLNDGQRLVVVSDASGEEALEIHHQASNGAVSQQVEKLTDLDIGRPIFLKVCPTADALVLGNHRYELIYVDLKEKQIKQIDKSNYAPISSAEWSLDGEWLVYSFKTSLHTSAIKLYHMESEESHYITSPHTTRDVGPSFDPAGRYIYFISYRDFDPVSDIHYFEKSFLVGARPYLITLQKNLPNPFIPLPEDMPPPTKISDNGEPEEEDEKEEKPSKPDKRKKLSVQIDLDGIQERIAAFPVSKGLYSQIKGVHKNKVLFSSYPVEDRLRVGQKTSKNSRGVLELYDLTERKKDIVVGGVRGFKLSRSRNFVLYRGSGKNLRVLKIGDKVDSTASGFNKKSGWIDLRRPRVAIHPPSEWRQMFREAWRLQRDHFWTEDMSHVDWQLIYERYYPLIERVASRYEFSDLLKEMQGELGTSHAYELGGDYRSAPRYYQGFLGADFVYDPEAEGYRIIHIVQGDHWLSKEDSPLNRLGVNAQEDDILLAIDGQPLSESVSPQKLLINRAGMEVMLTVRSNNHLVEEPVEEADQSESEGPSEESPEVIEETEAASEENGEPSEAESPEENGESSEETSGESEEPSEEISEESEEPSEEAPETTEEDEKESEESVEEETESDTSETYSLIRSVLVQTLRNERQARYREWVENNRRRVHEETDGRVGYVHIPDMGTWGYAEFHRYYLSESEREGLIIDVRFNRGGNVSQLLLEKLARRRIGYDQPRYGAAIPYPYHSVLGPMVALTNEHAGSDGDIFSHVFKIMDLGPLIGKRTWGGVIGIWPSRSLVDGTVTTQPEFSSWFPDVGWEVENYGTDPDIEVDIKPQDYAKGRDPQLARGLEEINKLLKENPPQLPDFGPKPSRALPKLPKIKKK